MLFMVVFFLAGNENTIKSMSTHCIGSEKVAFPLSFPTTSIQFYIVACFFLKGHPSLNMHHSIMLIIHILDHITMRPSHPYWIHFGFNGRAKRKSPSCKSLKGVYVIVLKDSFMFLGP
jgi:hypothetical protein